MLSNSFTSETRTMEYRNLNNTEIASIVSFSVTFNCEEARRMFFEKFGKEPPPARTLRDWKARFLDTLTILPRKPVGDHQQRRLSTEKKEDVLAAFGDDPFLSQRKVAQEVGVAQSSVNKILKEEGLKPWKMVSVQELLPDDPGKRLNFCRIVLTELEVKNICFSDEATFHLNGCVNKHNRFVYAMDNPKMIAEDKALRSPGITCWAMVSPDFGVVYELLETTMNSEHYKRILQTHVIPLLKQHRHKRKFYQQHGAPPHFAIVVRQLLDNQLNNRWIGRGGSIQWPPRSPDLSVCDFWLWGYIRNELYKPPRPSTATTLKERLMDLLDNIPKSMIRKAYESFTRRCKLCEESYGGHFEQNL